MYTSHVALFCMIIILHRRNQLVVRGHWQHGKTVSSFPCVCGKKAANKNAKNLVTISNWQISGFMFTDVSDLLRTTSQEVQDRMNTLFLYIISFFLLDQLQFLMTLLPLFSPSLVSISFSSILNFPYSQVLFFTSLMTFLPSALSRSIWLPCSKSSQIPSSPILTLLICSMSGSLQFSYSSKSEVHHV